MESASATHLQQMQAIVEFVASSTGTHVYNDRSLFLLQFGDDFDLYPFSWDPFRLLAAPLLAPPSAIPIAVVSTGEELPVPDVALQAQPLAFEQIRVSRTTPLVAIVDVWIGALQRQGVRLEKPAPEFLGNLGLKLLDVAPATRQFLGLELAADSDGARDGGDASGGLTSATWPELSETMQGVEGEVHEQEELTAFAIAAAIARRHPEYARGGLGAVDWSSAAPPTPMTQPWEVWRDSVANLYDEAAVRGSKHNRLSGRLFLVGLGLLDDGLRSALEDKAVWLPLLLEIDAAVTEASPALASVVGEIQLAHGYLNDQAGGIDQLGIQGEVNAVCEVITDPAVEPPLAVGLFGAWGSGKSFFMDKMRERIFELTRGPTRLRDLETVQIRFNAWHYTDTSLWASLAVEIFERLADPEPVDPDDHEKWLREQGDPNREKRENLLQNLETFRQAKAALEAEKAQLEVERERLEGQRTAAARARRNLVTRKPLTDVAAGVAADEQVRAKVAEVGERLGVTPAVEELSSLASELRTTGGYVAAVWRLVNRKTLVLGLLAAAGVLTLVAFGLASTAAHWAGSLVAGFVAVSSVVTTSVTQLRPAAKKTNEGLAYVEQGLRIASDVKSRLQAKRTEEERLLELRLEEQAQQMEKAARAIAEIDDKIAAVSAQAGALAVGRRLYDFLADRAAGYQKHQGVVGMLHRDFRLLDALLRAQADGAEPQPDAADAADAAELQPDAPALPRIDRVILYVDDLDRCPPAKVLEVLEAVHLLLALPLFVVVVGVDPRWLQRSLRHQYRDLLTREDATTDPYLQTMPVEYLEKIFQIPLALPAMEPAAYGRLIASLAPNVPAAELPTPPVSAPTQRATTPETPGGERAPTRALLTVQAGSAASGIAGHPIDLTSAEVGFAQRLGGLVDSPRAAKRLMNTYRLIRATQHVGSRSVFLGAGQDPGEYQAVLSLLAVAAGYPALADRVLVALEDESARPGIATWRGFVTALNPGSVAGPPGPLAPEDLRWAAGESSSPDRAAWANLARGLNASLVGNKLDALDPYVKWGRIVARFSFTI